MPWKESYLMDERVKFIGRLLDGEKMIELCREFGISRKAGYKFLDRYRKQGLDGLLNVRPGPRHIPHKTPEIVEGMIFKLRASRPSWGPKKIQRRLRELYPEIKWPAASTVGEILSRNGYVEARARRKKQRLFPYEPIAKSISPNDLWCIDFKGQFRLGNGGYCYPLTITDHHSRFLIACEALPDTKTSSVFPVLESVFLEYGLPKVILSDNGAPFASTGLARVSKLSAWFISLGIIPQQIEPGNPQQNGRHERMHKTLKQETTRPAKKNLLQQQESFDQFRKIYNIERPHEALSMSTPASIYVLSERKLENQKAQEYPFVDAVRKVSASGSIRVPGSGKICFVGRAFEGHYLGLTKLEPNLWKIEFENVKLGYLCEGKGHHYVSDTKPESVT